MLIVILFMIQIIIVHIEYTKVFLSSIIPKVCFSLFLKIIFLHLNFLCIQPNKFVPSSYASGLKLNIITLSEGDDKMIA